MPGASGCPKPKFLTCILVIDDDATTAEDGACSTQEVDAGTAAEAGAATALGAAGAAAEEIEPAAAPARPSPLQASPPPGLARALAPAAGSLEPDAN